MKKNAKGVVGAVRTIAEPLAEELGYVLWDVEVRLYAPMNGAKSYLGTLAGLNEAGEVLLAVEGQEEPIAFPRASIASLKTRFQFD